MIVVNPSTRQFNVPGADLVFGVESDSGSVVKEFQCPRYVGNNLDLAGSFLRINYRNANGEIDEYLVKDVTISGENIEFRWELTPKVTMYKGQISFVMCVVGPDTKVKWHTTLGKGQVLEGLEPDAHVVEDGTADVVAQLIAMVESQTVAVEKTGADQVAVVKAAAKTAQDSAVTEIEAKRVNSLASIPADYTALSATVDTVTRTVAPGIVCSAEGEVVTLNDASDNYLRGLRIFGKSTQDGIPTPENPVKISSVGDDGAIDVTIWGKNICDIYAFSASGMLSPSTSPTLSNNSGTSISTTKPAQYLSVTQDGIHNTSEIKSYQNGYFIIGFYNELKYGDVVTVSFDVDVTENHGGSNELFLMPNGVVYSDYYGEALIESGRVEKTIKWAISNSTPDRQYLEIRNCGKSMTISNIQIEIGDKATKYEPHKKQSLTISTPNGLPSVPVSSSGNYTDANGQQWICDEVDFERGVYVQNVGLLDFSSMVWYWDEDYDVWRSQEFGDGKARTPLLCETIPNILLSLYDGTMFGTLINAPYNIWARNGSNETTPTGKGYYQMKTPIEIPLSETELAAYRALHTNKPNTTIFNDSGAYMSVDYTADTKLYIDNLIKNL